MIKFFCGGMIGRIGNIVWCNGADQCANEYLNTLLSGGHTRFGACWLLSPEHAEGFCRVLTPREVRL